MNFVYKNYFDQTKNLLDHPIEERKMRPPVNYI